MPRSNTNKTSNNSNSPRRSSARLQDKARTDEEFIKMLINIPNMVKTLSDLLTSHNERFTSIERMCKKLIEENAALKQKSEKDEQTITTLSKKIMAVQPSISNYLLEPLDLDTKLEEILNSPSEAPIEGQPSSSIEELLSSTFDKLIDSPIEDFFNSEPTSPVSEEWVEPLDYRATILADRGMQCRHK